MHYPKYTDILISSELDVYEFVSKGPKGSIVKKIQFRETIDPSIYNLGFGDKMEDGCIDDNAKSNNGDRDKILVTVVDAIYKFTSVYPKRKILFFGSDNARNRLYRMAISKNYAFLSKDFNIFDLKENGEEIVTEPFSIGIPYSGFLVERIM